MSKEKKEFGIDFQIDVLRYILKESKFFILVRKYLRKDFFTKYLSEIFVYIQFHIEKYGRLPDRTVLLNNFKNDKIILRFIKRITNKKGINEIQEKYLREKLQEFFKRNLFIRVFNDSATLYNEGKLNESLDLMNKGIEKIKLIDLDIDKYEFLFKDFEKRILERQLRKDNYDDFIIPTGIPKLSKYINGGLRNGEVGLLIGDAKGSKSTGLRYFGVSAAKRYFNVLHIQLEDSKQKCLDSYDALLLKQSYHDVRNANVPPAILDKVINQIKDRRKKDLVIKAFPDWDSCSIQEIDDIWFDLYTKGIFCHLVIIDYLDLLQARRKYNEERFRQTSLAKDVKSFAIKRNVAVWTATQTHRGIENEDPNFVITEKNVAEDYGKIRAVDIPISINATSEELDKNLARVHICRGRVVKGGYTFRISQDLNNGLFFVSS